MPYMAEPSDETTNSGSGEGTVTVEPSSSFFFLVSPGRATCTTRAPWSSTSRPLA